MVRIFQADANRKPLHEREKNRVARDIYPGGVQNEHATDSQQSAVPCIRRADSPLQRDFPFLL